MTEWKLIETAPKDGTVVRLKRVHEREVISDGPGCWGKLDPAALSLRPMGPDPLAVRRFSRRRRSVE